MPSGKTHDVITFALAPPTLALAWAATGSLPLAIAATCGMIFGGLMFGPDLDVQSRQYTRWGVFRVLWFPYKMVFRHRSRWSHGILFGTLIRVLYFTGMLTLLLWGGIYLRALFIAGGAVPDWSEFLRAWHFIEAGAALYGVSVELLLAVLFGLWWGAASHTITDVGWSMLRKGSEIF